MFKNVITLSVLVVLVLPVTASERVLPFSAAFVDRSVVGSSKHPLAVDPSRAGTYPGRVKSGAGYFYDEVLEYRVWLHPEKGATQMAGDKDYFAAFAQFEQAKKFSGSHRGAEDPLVLVRQRESINEPTPGVFEWDRTPRITEWRVQWLAGSLRRHDSIPKFLKEHRQASPPRPGTTSAGDGQTDRRRPN
jgi:hypothetical protein